MLKTKRKLKIGIRKSGNCPYGKDNTKTCDFSSTGLNSEAYYNFIASVKWYTGGPDSESRPVDSFYSDERESNRFANNTSSDWIGKVGLIYPSDFGYATGKSSCIDETNMNNYSSSSCENWLTPTDASLWTITHNSNGNSDIYAVGTNSRLISTYVWRTIAPSFETRPVVYLNSDVIKTGGDGSSTNPYSIRR